MPCSSAMTDHVFKLSPDQPVEEALAQMKEQGLEVAPVVDQDNIFQGLFSFSHLFQNLLPVTMPTSDGIQLDITLNAAPGIAKRLRKVLPLPVEQFIDRKVAVVYPETPTWEGINMLTQNGGLPLAVIDSQTGVFVGMIDRRSALTELLRMQD